MLYIDIAKFDCPLCQGRINVQEVADQDFIRRLEKPSAFSCPHCGANLCFAEKAGRLFQAGAVISFLISPVVAFVYSPSSAIFVMVFGLLVLGYGLLSQKLVVQSEAKEETDVAKSESSYSMNIAIDHDDYHARQVGRTKDGLQFFLTEPFYFDHKRSIVNEYVALYLFRSDGELFSHNIVYLGQRGEFSEAYRAQIYSELLNSLVDASNTRIEVKPFIIERDGIKFGLIPREPDDDENLLSVQLLPGNYMAFYEPWGSGIYDT